MPRPKECIFCGGRPLTREHLFGKWLSPVVVEAISDPSFSKRDLYIETDRMKDGVLAPQGRRSTNKVNITVGCVCKTCNNEWMGDMEKAVIPIMKSLLGDGVHTVDESEQFELARWAAKTAVIARYVAGFEVAPIYREWLYKHHSIPINTLVWIGKYSGEGVISLDSKNIFFERNGETIDLPNVQFVTFTASRLLIVVLMFHIEGKFDFRPPELIAKWLRLISPYQGDIVWPFDPLDEGLRQSLVQSNLDNTIIFPPAE